MRHSRIRTNLYIWLYYSTALLLCDKCTDSCSWIKTRYRTIRNTSYEHALWIFTDRLQLTDINDFARKRVLTRAFPATTTLQLKRNSDGLLLCVHTQHSDADEMAPTHPFASIDAEFMHMLHTAARQPKPIHTSVFLHPASLRLLCCSIVDDYEWRYTRVHVCTKYGFYSSSNRSAQNTPYADRPPKSKMRKSIIRAEQSLTIPLFSLYQTNMCFCVFPREKYVAIPSHILWKKMEKPKCGRNRTVHIVEVWFNARAGNYTATIILTYY